MRHKIKFFNAYVYNHKDHSQLVDLHNQIDYALRELQERKSEYERLLENDDFPRKFGVSIYYLTFYLILWKIILI